LALRDVSPESETESVRFHGAEWVFAVIGVWSRLWPSTVVGKRSYRNTLDLFRDLSNRMSLEAIPLITTDAFKFYERAWLTSVRHSAISEGICSVAALRFSRRCSTEDVPGINRMFGDF
jgi:hypothetical protein